MNRYSYDEDCKLKELYNKYLLKDLIKFFPGRTKDALRNHAVALGLKRSDEYKEIYLQRCRERCLKLDQTLTWQSLDLDERQIIIGSLFGDGGIIETRTGCIYGENHGVVQQDYVFWKFNKLVRFKPWKTKSKWSNGFIGFRTPTHCIFDELRKKFYHYTDTSTKLKLKNQLPIDLLNEMNYLGLLIWYLDDGSKMGNNYKCFTISVDSFIESNLQECCDIINEKFSLTSKLYKKPTYKIFFNTKDSLYLARIWRKIYFASNLPDCMLYKIDVPNSDGYFCDWQNPGC